MSIFLPNQEFLHGNADQVVVPAPDFGELMHELFSKDLVDEDGSFSKDAGYFTISLENPTKFVPHATCVQSESNNHPQTFRLGYREDNIIDVIGDRGPSYNLMLNFDDRNSPFNTWYSPSNPLLIGSLCINGTSIARDGVDYTDAGVRITVLASTTGLFFTMGFADSGDKGDNPVYGFGNKVCKLWLPLVRGADFNDVSLRRPGQPDWPTGPVDIFIGFD
jgi:hypothetical protein